MWLTEEEQKIFDIGWLIGFFVGEGTACFKEKKDGRAQFHVSICQQEILPLIKAQEILISLGCEQKDLGIFTRDKFQGTSALNLKYPAIEIFVSLIKKFPFYSTKREENLQKFLIAWEKYQFRLDLKIKNHGSKFYNGNQHTIGRPKKARK